MPSSSTFLLVFMTLVCVSAGAKKASSSSNRRNEYSVSAKKPADNVVLHDQNSNQKVQEPPKNDDNTLSELFETIFGDYHKEIVPKRPTIVRLDLVLIKVKSTNERDGVFEAVVALLMEWEDRRLLWNPANFGNVTVLAFDSDKVWLPDIAMTNSADHLYALSKDTRFVVRVSYDGTMKFVPTGTSRSWCDLKLLTFPFDRQTCSYEFESWSMDSSTITINDSSTAVVDDSFSSPQWALCDYSATVYDHYYEFSGEVFTRLRFDFVVRRKTTFYLINLIFPCATLSMIQLMVFLIPSTDATSDRISFGTTNLLTLVVFQTIVTEEMPKSSDSVTALSKYIISLIVISAVGIVEAVAAERLLRPRSTPPPRWMMKLRKFPLLWETQLPSGISGMMLQLWSTGKYLENRKKIAEIKKAEKKKKRRCPFHKRRQRVGGDSARMPILMAEEQPEVSLGCFPTKNNRISSLIAKKQMQIQADFDWENADCYSYDGSMRHSPSPVFRANAAYKGHPMSNIKSNGKMVGNGNLPRLFSMTDGFSDEPGVSNNNSDFESDDIIEIGKMWGAVVTRLDGLTFICCALCNVLLPISLFLPLLDADSGEKCR